MNPKQTGSDSVTNQNNWVPLKVQSKRLLKGSDVTLQVSCSQFEDEGMEAGTKRHGAEWGLECWGTVEGGGTGRGEGPVSRAVAALPHLGVFAFFLLPELPFVPIFSVSDPDTISTSLPFTSEGSPGRI